MAKYVKSYKDETSGVEYLKIQGTRLVRDGRQERLPDLYLYPFNTYYTYLHKQKLTYIEELKEIDKKLGIIEKINNEKS